MLPNTSHLKILIPRARNILGKVEKEIWEIAKQPLAVQQSTSSKTETFADNIDSLTFSPVSKYPHIWGSPFEQCWWKIHLPIEQKNRYLLWRDRGEATIYANGVPIHGIDPGHIYCPLPDDIEDILIESICCRTAYWIDEKSEPIDSEGSRFDGAFLAYRNDEAWHAYYDLEILIDLLELEIKRFNNGRDFGEIDRGKHADLERFSPEGRLLIRGLDEAHTIFYQHGLRALREHLEGVYKRLTSNPMTMKMRLVGHAHIDLVWMWEEKTGEFKAVHTFSTVSTLMKEYPELTFCYSQPPSYEAVARRSPQLFEEVQKHIDSGQWEPLGATEVECDTQIPCGEALIRCFEVGQEGFRNLTGKNNSILWIPDVFGYSACLPQIMKSCDVDYFYTTKLLWNDSTDFPHSSFVWQGQDGTEVIAHLSLKNGYNRLVKPDQLLDTALTHQQSDIHPEALEPTGYGDGGGGPTAEMCERARRVKEIFGMPKTQWGRVDDFFENLSKIKDQLPSYKGELYLEFHRGVLTTLGTLKYAYRIAERALQTWEAVRSCTGGCRIDKAAWKRLLFTQFHDYLPGTSVKEVYDEGIPELQKITASALASAQTELGTAKTNSIFNPLPLTLSTTYQTEEATYPIELPPLSGGEPQTFKCDYEKDKVACTEKTLTNNRLQATFDDNGFIETMIVNCQNIEFTGPAGELRVFDDNPAYFPAWEIDRASLNHGNCFSCKPEVEIENSHPSSASISFSRKLTDESSIEIVYALRSNSSTLEINYFIDWQNPNKLLKVLFPTAYAGQNARYGNPYGSILRSQQPGELHNEAKFEVPGSRYAMVFDDTEDHGLCVVTESKYGFGCSSGLLHLSLLRGAIITQPEVTSYNIEEPDTHYADIGKQHIRIAIGAYHSELKRDEQPAALAETLFCHPLAYQGNPVSSLFQGIEGGESLIPSWAKPVGEDSFILRCHEVLGKRGQAKLKLAENCSLTKVDMLDRPIADSGTINDNTISFSPYEIISLLIKKESAS